MYRCAPPASPVLSFCCFFLQCLMQHWDHFNSQLLMDGQAGRTLVQNEVLLLCFFPAFPTMNAPLEKGSSPALGAACPLNYNHTRKFLLQSTHYTQRQSQIYLVASRLYFLLSIRARKYKVRAGEHKCKAGSQLET